jgi:hypothetical protein
MSEDYLFPTETPNLNNDQSAPQSEEFSQDMSDVEHKPKDITPFSRKVNYRFSGSMNEFMSNGLCVQKMCINKILGKYYKPNCEHRIGKVSLLDTCSSSPVAVAVTVGDRTGVCVMPNDGEESTCTFIIEAGDRTSGLNTLVCDAVDIKTNLRHYMHFNFPFEEAIKKNCRYVKEAESLDSEAGCEIPVNGPFYKTIMKYNSFFDIRPKQSGRSHCVIPHSMYTDARTAFKRLHTKYTNHKEMPICIRRVDGCSWDCKDNLPCGTMGLHGSHLLRKKICVSFTLNVEISQFEITKC